MVSPSKRGKRVEILIVEDDALVASYINAVLDEAGYAVTGSATSGQEALALAEDARPALALVDIRISGPLDGIEVACASSSAFRRSF